jgi:hypothetical protein
MVGLSVCGMAACSSGSDDSGDNSGEAIAIDPATEDPSKILPPDFTASLQAVISPADVGKTFGLDDDHIPYPDTYWPFKFTDQGGKVVAKNGIDDRWQNQNELSPLEKFMGLFDGGHTKDAQKWEADNHGVNVPGVQSWFGHCPGWTGSSMVNAPLTQGVSVKSDGGNLVACQDGDQGCTTFEIGDINALEAEVFVDGESTFLGARCDTAPAKIKRDANGRVLQQGCRGMNPGALMVIFANKMKNIKNDPNFKPKAIAIDAQNQFNTDQIWNQPSYRYQVNAAKAMSESEAIAAIVKKPPIPAKYPFNPNAKGWFKVDIGIKWVQENGPNREPVSGAESTQTMRFSAVLELDGDPSSASTKIIGGEFIDDPSAGANRLVVPPFVWTTTGPGPEDTQDHNPFVKSSKVMQLVKMALGQ